MTDEQPKRLRGFALLTPEQRRENASKAGRAVKPENRHFARDRDAAAKAGTKGGAALAKLRRKP